MIVLELPTGHPSTDGMFQKLHLILEHLIPARRPYLLGRQQIGSKYLIPSLPDMTGRKVAKMKRKITILSAVLALTAIVATGLTYATSATASGGGYFRQ